MGDMLSQAHAARLHPHGHRTFAAQYHVLSLVLQRHSWNCRRSVSVAQCAALESRGRTGGTFLFRRIPVPHIYAFSTRLKRRVPPRVCEVSPQTDAVRTASLLP